MGGGDGGGGGGKDGPRYSALGSSALASSRAYSVISSLPCKAAAPQLPMSMWTSTSVRCRLASSSPLRLVLKPAFSSFALRSARSSRARSIASVIATPPSPQIASSDSGA